jgi:hypothetical protein
VLYSQFAHLAVARAFDTRRAGKRERRTVLHQQIDNSADAHLFRVVQAHEPVDKLVDTLDFPN